MRRYARADQIANLDQPHGIIGRHGIEDAAVDRGQCNQEVAVLAEAHVG